MVFIHGITASTLVGRLRTGRACSSAELSGSSPEKCGRLLTRLPLSQLPLWEREEEFVSSLLVGLLMKSTEEDGHETRNLERRVRILDGEGPEGHSRNITTRSQKLGTQT